MCCIQVYCWKKETQLEISILISHASVLASSNPWRFQTVLTLSNNLSLSLNITGEEEEEEEATASPAAANEISADAAVVC